MTLHALRLQVGDHDVLPAAAAVGARSNAGGNVTTAQFIALAERISGQELDGLLPDVAVRAGEAGRLGLRRDAFRRAARASAAGAVEVSGGAEVDGAVEVGVEEPGVVGLPEQGALELVHRVR